MSSAAARARRESGWAFTLVLVLYVAAAALLPLAHHDIACHLKSSTHCTTCVVGSAGDLAADTSFLQHSPLDDAGKAGAQALLRVESRALGAIGGRAPPRAI